MGTLSCYLDTSVVIALLKPEALSDRADNFISENPTGVIVSDFAAAEFASAVARSAQRVEISPADVAVASAFLRRLDLPLRTPDAIHIAIAQRVGATLVTFDRRMAASARAIGAAVAEP